MFVKVLSRLEREYNTGRPDLVKSVMTLFTTARHGLSDSELLDLLGTNGERLPASRWAPLHLALRPYLVSRSGLLAPLPPALRAAIERYYLPTADDRASAHRRLADYFAARPISPRVVEEWPWHLAALGEWRALSQVLAQPEFLNAAWPTHRFEIRSYWAMVESEAGIAMSEALAGLVDDRDRHPEAAWAARSSWPSRGTASRPCGWLSGGCVREGQPAGSRPLTSLVGWLWRSEIWRPPSISRRSRRRPRPPRAMLTPRSPAWRGRRRCTVVMASWTAPGRASSRRRNSPTSLGPCATASAICWDSAARLLEERGDSAGALRLNERRATLYRQIGDLNGLCDCLGLQGRLLFRLRRSARALAALAAQETVARQLHDRATIQGCLGDQAEVLMARRRLDDALARISARESVCLDPFDPRGLALTLLQKATLYGTVMKQTHLGLDFVAKAERLIGEHGLDDIRTQAETVRGVGGGA